MKLAMTIGILVLFVSSPLLWPQAGTAPAASPERIAELVKQLGDNNFKTREEAQKELTRIGSPAREALQQAAQSKDMEVQQRASTILSEIARSAFNRSSLVIARNLLWSVPVKAGIAGAPLVKDGVVYAPTADGKLLAVEAKTGKALWTCEETAEGSASLTEPILSGGLLFVTDGSKMLYAVDAAKGKVLWKFEVPAAALNAGRAAGGLVAARVARIRNLNATAGLPAAADGKVYMPDGGNSKLYALDANSGEKKWEADLPNGCFGRPAAGDGIVCAAAGDGTVQAMDSEGKQLWQMSLNSPATGLTLIDGRLCFVAEGILQALDAKTGQSLWKVDLPSPSTATSVRMTVVVNGRVRTWNQCDDDSVAVADGTVYAVSGGNLVAVSAKDGKKKWEYKLVLKAEELKDEQSAAGNDGDAVVVMGGAAGGVQLKAQVAVLGGRAVFNRSGLTFVSLAVGKDAAYVGTANGLHAIDLRTGQRLWYLPTSGAVAGRPVLVNGVVYFGTAPAAAMPVAVNVNNGGAPDDNKPAKEKEPIGLHALKVNP
jgi:outer membrane protein assembly factor BamB